MSNKPVKRQSTIRISKELWRKSNKLDLHGDYIDALSRSTFLHSVAPDLGPILNHHQAGLNKTKDLGTLTTCDDCGVAYPPSDEHECQKQIKGKR